MQRSANAWLQFSIATTRCIVCPCLSHTLPPGWFTSPAGDSSSNDMNGRLLTQVAQSVHREDNCKHRYTALLPTHAQENCYTTLWNALYLLGNSRFPLLAPLCYCIIEHAVSLLDLP